MHIVGTDAGASGSTQAGAAVWYGQHVDVASGPANLPDAGEQVLTEDLSPKRIHLIRTTYQLIGEKGVRRLSLREVADAAGVSKSLIFYYFKTRENLILATMRWVLSRTAERIRQATGPAQNPEETVVAMIDEIFADPEANVQFYVTYLDLVDQTLRSDDFSKLSATFRSIVNAFYADVISLGLAQGAFLVHDVQEAATAVRAIVDGMFLQWIQENERERSHAQYRDACKRAVLAYLHSSSDGFDRAAHAFERL